MDTVYFITHPDVLIEPETVPVPEWRLNAREVSRERAPCWPRSWVPAITHVASSGPNARRSMAPPSSPRVSTCVPATHPRPRRERPILHRLPASARIRGHGRCVLRCIPTESVRRLGTRGGRPGADRRRGGRRAAGRAAPAMSRWSPMAASARCWLCHLHGPCQSAARRDQPPGSGGYFLAFDRCRPDLAPRLAADRRLIVSSPTQTRSAGGSHNT
jgi:hypothetical protein